MRKPFIIVIFIYLLIMSASCSWNDFSDMSGNEVVEIVFVSSFTEIDVYDIFDVVLIQDSICFVEIMGNENMVNSINLNVENDVLEIYQTNSQGLFSVNNDKVKLQIHFVNFNILHLFAPCSVFCADTIQSEKIGVYVSTEMAEIEMKLNCSVLCFWNSHDNAGSVFFEGNADYAEMKLYYLAQLNAMQLNINNLKIENHSEGDIHVLVRDTLEVSVYKKGNVYYYTSPKSIIKKTMRGYGKLIKAY